MIYLIIGGILVCIYVCIYAFFSFLDKKIKILELKIIGAFSERSDVFPSLIEVCSTSLSRHNEIFFEANELRKQKYALGLISDDIEAFMKLETKFHHEINFIFLVSNKHPKLLTNKKFLYIREIVMQKSSEISTLIGEYKKVITMYNTFIDYKNYSGIGLLVPYSKKRVL